MEHLLETEACGRSGSGKAIASSAHWEPSFKAPPCVSASPETSLGDGLHWPYAFKTFTVHLWNGSAEYTGYKNLLTRKISHPIQL